MHFGFPEQQATSQTRPVNSQGVPLGGVVPAVCCSACVGCLRWIPAQKDAKTRFLAPWHPTVAATNNLMTDLYLTNEMSSFWPGLGPWFGSVIWCHCTCKKSMPAAQKVARCARGGSCASASGEAAATFSVPGCEPLVASPDTGARQCPSGHVLGWQASLIWAPIGRNAGWPFFGIGWV